MCGSRPVERLEYSAGIWIEPIRLCDDSSSRYIYILLKSQNSANKIAYLWKGAFSTLLWGVPIYPFIIPLNYAVKPRFCKKYKRIKYPVNLNRQTNSSKLVLNTNWLQNIQAYLSFLSHYSISSTTYNQIWYHLH